VSQVRILPGPLLLVLESNIFSGFSPRIHKDLLHLNYTLRRELLRSSRGEGSVYQRKDGLWVARYVAAGKRKYVYGKSKKAVTDKLREKDTVKERTWERHEQVVRLHLKPSIGRVKLQKLNALDVQELYRTKLDSGLSPRTVQIVHTTLHKALKLPSAMRIPQVIALLTMFVLLCSRLPSKLWRRLRR
jgi:hypothetical protein